MVVSILKHLSYARKNITSLQEDLINNKQTAV